MAQGITPKSPLQWSWKEVMKGKKEARQYAVRGQKWSGLGEDASQGRYCIRTASQTPAGSYSSCQMGKSSTLENTSVSMKWGWSLWKGGRKRKASQL